jgi:hypothetical protein
MGYFRKETLPLLLIGVGRPPIPNSPRQAKPPEEEERSHGGHGDSQWGSWREGTERNEILNGAFTSRRGRIWRRNNRMKEEEVVMRWCKRRED